VPAAGSQEIIHWTTLNNPLTAHSKPSSDIGLLFTTRIIRLFCYGFLSVILALYLVQVGLNEKQIGLLFTLTLAGDAAISLWLTTSQTGLVVSGHYWLALC
jgi:hypothetical protein